MKVICNKSFKWESSHGICAVCEHAEPHEVVEKDTQRCTEWGECTVSIAHNTKVRCVKVKGNGEEE